MKYTIDIDWTQALIYDQNHQIVYQEPALCLRELRTEKLVAIGNEAKNKLPEKQNWIVVGFIENRTLWSQKDFLIFIDYLVKKYQLQDFNFVNRYQLQQKDFNFELLNETSFIKSFVHQGIYLDIRNNESLVYDCEQNQLTIIPIGIINVINYLQRYFYLNFNATLNGSKLQKLLTDLSQKTVTNVNCRSYQTGSDVEIKIDENKMLKETQKLNQLIKSAYQKTTNVYKTNNYKKVFFFDN